MLSIAITGATGFVGSALFQALSASSKYAVKGLCRTLPAKGGVEGLLALGNLETADFSQALAGVDVVIHAAARAHMLDDNASDPLLAFRQTNVGGSLNLANQAAKVGVKRFIFISSIGVNGGSTCSGAFTENDTPKPHTPYAQSKLEAEEALKMLCYEAGMELVIIRPPLIYAAHAPGNFARLLKLVDKRIPLPFGLVKNQRSFIALENIIHFIALCIEHPQAANQTFVIADDTPISTPTLLRFLAKGMQKPSLLLPFPVGLMRLGARVLGREAMFEQLCGSLQVDASKAKELLDWQPPLTTEQGLEKTAQHFLTMNSEPK